MSVQALSQIIFDTAAAQPKFATQLAIEVLATAGLSPLDLIFGEALIELYEAYRDYDKPVDLNMHATMVSDLESALRRKAASRPPHDPLALNILKALSRG